MGTFIIISLTLLAIVFGTLLTWFVIERASFQARLVAGAVIGLALLAWIAFLTTLVFKLKTFSLIVAILVFGVGSSLLAQRLGIHRLRAELAKSKLERGDVLYYAGWAALLVWLFSRVVMFYPDGLHTAPANNYGDLPFHFSVITSMAYGENLPPQNPIFAGMKFTYPFLIDYLTAFFLSLGADWRAAFFVENIVLSLALVGLIELLTFQIFGNRLAARLAPVLFLFNGGLGFLNFFHELSAQSEGLLQFLAHLPKTYTMNAELAFGASNIPLRWGNVFTTLLIPQRSMLFGLPFVALIVTLWWMACGEAIEVKARRRYLFAAGLLAGLLPMLHAHGFFAVGIACVPMVLLFWSWDWLAFFAPVAVLAGPQALWLSGTQVRNKLFELHWGWEAGESNPLIFWAVNAGAFILLLLAALFVKRLTTVRQAKFYLPFAIWFLLPNVVLLAPWPWDNIKVLVYWALASSPFVAAALAFLFSQKLVTARIAAAILFVLLVTSGGLDVARALSPVENVGLFGKDDLDVAAQLREKTPPRAVVLHAPIHNSLVALSGRQSVMGYPGHLWTHGIEYGTREAEVKTIYRGGPESLAPLARLNVDYVLIGPVERKDLQPDEAYFSSNYPVIVSLGEYQVYRIRK